MMYMYLYPLKTILILKNSTDPNEMPCDAVFHLGRHCQSICLGVSRLKKGLGRIYIWVTHGILVIIAYAFFSLLYVHA